MLAVRQNRIASFCDARFISIAGPSPGKGTSREVPDFLPHDTNRWTFNFLQRSWPKGRADNSPAARASVIVADVRATLRPASRWLSPCRARLSRLRTQRLAGPEQIRVYLRSLR